MADPRRAPPRVDYATRVDVGHRALELRADLDAVLKKHGARLLLGWEGKRAKIQLMFPDASTELALTIIETAKGKRVRYVLEEEER